jgi:hypothetical protein
MSRYPFFIIAWLTLTLGTVSYSGDTEPIHMVRGYRVIALADLGNYKLDYDVAKSSKASAEKANGQIPAWVWSLNGKKVEIDGYMIPIEMNGRYVKSFALTHSSSGCCFGISPRINGWIYVNTNDDTKGSLTLDDPSLEVSVYGTLRIGLPINVSEPSSVYRIMADEVAQAGASSY